MWNFFGDVKDRLKQNLENLVRDSGYPWEEYTVTTEDGYINSIYRIPHGKIIKSNINKSRPPVLLIHGMNCSSANFLNHCTLGYYLADEGYDVWLPNNRGTTYSRKHVYLDAEKDKEKYWDFSWHEIGKYDIPAFVDFVIEQTGFQKVFYIGHSQGTTTYAVFASERPEYGKKISLSCFLGCAIPTTYFRGSSYRAKILIHLFVPFLEIIDKYVIRLYEGPLTNFTRAGGCFTYGKSTIRNFGLAMMYLTCGNSNYEQLTEFEMDKFCQTAPNSSAFRQWRHFAQNLQKGIFAQFDYGPARNLEKYGTTEPPHYDLSKITSPVALFYGKNDMYNDYTEDNLDKKMANVVHVHIVKDEKFNHLDFLCAKDSIPLVYEPMVKIMRKYEDL